MPQNVITETGQIMTEDQYMMQTFGTLSPGAISTGGGSIGGGGSAIFTPQPNTFYTYNANTATPAGYAISQWKGTGGNMQVSYTPIPKPTTNEILTIFNLPTPSPSTPTTIEHLITPAASGTYPIPDYSPAVVGYGAAGIIGVTPEQQAAFNASIGIQTQQTIPGHITNPIIPGTTVSNTPTTNPLYISGAPDILTPYNTNPEGLTPFPVQEPTPFMPDIITPIQDTITHIIDVINPIPNIQQGINKTLQYAALAVLAYLIIKDNK